MNLKVIPNYRFFAMIENEIRAGRSMEIRVKGSSMHPALKNEGHRVVLAPLRKEYLHTGTIALFTYKGKHVLHRLVVIDGDKLTFQGDNLPYKRERVSREDVIAFAEYIITPHGRVIDCKTACYRMRSRVLVFTNRFVAFPLRRAKAVCSGVFRKR